MFVEAPTNINALMIVSEESRNRSVQWPISVGTLFYSKVLDSGAGGRSAPHKRVRVHVSSYTERVEPPSLATLSA